MIRGLYGAAGGMESAAQNQDVIAYNLAHANVPGFRRGGLVQGTFDQALAKSTAASAPLGSRPVAPYHDFSPGVLQHTGNPYDVALDGDGFFVLQGPNGPVYTRNGVLQRGPQGQLQNKSGLAVLGVAGPLVIPATATDVKISNDGTIQANGQLVGRLQQARFADPHQLVQAGPSLFTAPAGLERLPGTARVLAGYRESSNVQPASEMVAMIRGARYFDAAQRALRALSEAVQLNTKP